MDVEKDKNGGFQDLEAPWNTPSRIETHRSGIFQFQAGINLARLQPLLDRIQDAHKRFASVPVLPEVANKLEQEVMLSSIYGTNTIESGTLTEEETAAVLESPEKAREEKERRVVNIRRAYDIAEGFGKHWSENRESKEPPHLILREEMFKELHKAITQGLSHPDNVPGQYRDNPKERRTQVGDLEHGGVYTPPKCLTDIKILMQAFIEWANSAPIYYLPPLIRAPLVHYYFERIHPFWDGNGRVGRMVEAMILKAAGYKYAPLALSRYYLENIDRYFTLFNLARKAEEKGDPWPNQAFVEFFLQGMLTVLNNLHDHVNQIIAYLLYRSRVRDLHEGKMINTRQYTIVTHLLSQGLRHKLAEIQAQPWYAALYKGLTTKTRARDIKGLVEHQLIVIGDDDGKTVFLLVPFEDSAGGA
ncbi:MAG: Fic family protein [Pseudomonadota bacterium]